MPGAVHVHTITDPAAPLRTDLTFVPAPGGGAQTLTLDAGVGNAGRSSLVLGSASGTEPSVLVNGLDLPVVEPGAIAEETPGAE